MAIFKNENGTAVMYSGSGGSGGHTILNPSGTEMEQREKLKFVGDSISVTDDSTNNTTVVNVDISTDATPTQGSTNVVQSGGVYNALQDKTSGHLVVNNSTTFPQRGKIKFVNATITDDSTNDATVIEVESGGTTIVQKPTVTVGSYTYNGSEQGPSITWTTGMDEYCVVTNAKKVNAGNYTLTIELKNAAKMVWQDMTTASLTYSYTIAKAVGSVSVSPSSITLDANHLSETASITVIGDGVLTVTNNDTSGIYNYSYNSSTKVISVSENDEASGSSTVSIVLAEGNNYLGASTSLSVTASFKPELVAWGSGTDEQIAAMIDGYYSGALTLAEIQQVWHIGDTRNVTISAIAASGTGWEVGESHRSQTVQMQILGFDHDTLTNGIGNKSKALITVDTKNVLVDVNTSFDGTGGSTNTENGYINSTGTNVNSWRGSARRGWCNNGFYNALPNYFKNRVKQVNKITSTGNQQTTTETTADYCYLLSEWEIFGAKTRAAIQEGTQYAWYANATANHYKLPKWNDSSVSDVWWERSPYGSDAAGFCRVSANGSASTSYASNAYGLAPACSL